MKFLQDLQSAKQRQWREVSPALDSRRQLPFSPGVYVFYGRNNNVLYVGKSKILRNRVSSYFQSRADLIPKIRLFVPQISKIKISQTNTEFEALLLEARLIREMGPKYNSRLTDDRSPLYIVITDEDFPRVLTARKTDLGRVEARSVYGPFLSGETVRRVVKIARRMFPYCNQTRLSVSNTFKKARPFLKRPGLFGTVRYRRVCFYRHLGLCPGVCSGEISRRRYLSIIKKLEQFLAGDFAGLKVKLETEMKSAAKKQEFEKAAKARDAATALGSLTLAGEQEEETRIDGKERVKALIRMLNKVGIGETARQWDGETVVSKTVGRYTDSPAYRSTDYRSTVSRFHRYTDFRIEGFDVSNLGGRLATAAMAVFTGGIKDPGEYRHFRIRGKFSPDDPRMIAEAVERRLMHPEWGKPDLMVIDGGKPQLLCIKRTLLGARLRLPLAYFANYSFTARGALFGGQVRQGESLIYLGLAKNPDRLVIPSGNGFKTTGVSSRDLGFQLLQQVRDEAHRFSRRLHLGLRRRQLLM